MRSLFSIMTRSERGTQGEERAADYLKKQGLRLLERNYRCRLGEIDLVMLDAAKSAAATLVFVEVRVRQSADFGDAAASVTRSKQQKIIRAAQHYLQHHVEFNRYPCRFDVVSMTANETPQWLAAAFDASS